MAHIRKYWKLLLAIILVIAGLVFWSNRNTAAQTASSITTTTVTRGNFVNVLTSSGKTKADKTVELKFQTSGKLTWVGVKEGDTVNAYQAVAKLDSREVQKNLEKALRDYASERNDFDQSGLDSPAIKPSDAANDRVRRILEKNQWDLEQAVLDVELKNLAVEFATLVTPIAGIVTHVDTPVAGVNITPATAVFAVADPTSLVFEANVDETDVGSLSVGQTASVALDAFPEATFSGTVSYISYISEQSSGGATVFPVKISLGNAPNLRIGLNGDIRIETSRKENVLMVPTEAIREENGQTYVFKKAGERYEKTTVKTGAKNEDVIIITEGVSEGDQIVTKGFARIPK